MSSLFDWSATASSNTTCDSIGINTGMSPANVDNVFRSMMALIRNSFTSALQSFFAGTGALPVANGGTGAASASAALTALGALSSAYRDLVIVDKSAAFALADADRGSGYNYTGAAAALTINPNATTAITRGAVFVGRNGGTGALTITRGAGVGLYLNGSNSSADVVVAIGGVFTLTNWGVDFFTVSGVGVS